MNRYAITAVLLGAVSLGFANAAPTSPAPKPFHCQVPCGIYGDSLRISMLNEDIDTIAKGMAKIREMESAESFESNQMVRWIMNKDTHAASIQEQVASYWLAQRIKAPKDRAGREKYVTQLELLHGMTVSAMKCKQTTNNANAEMLRELVSTFSAAYFSEEDLKHMREHGGK